MTTHAIVSVKRLQAVTFSGRTLVSVKLVGDILHVEKKRERSGKYDVHYFHENQIVAFCEGVGGIGKPAYASVVCETVVRRAEGIIKFMPHFVRVTAVDGNVHSFRLTDNLSITEEVDRKHELSEAFVEPLEKRPVKWSLSSKYPYAGSTKKVRRKIPV